MVNKGEREERGKDKLGAWDLQIHITVYKLDKQNESIEWPRELYSISYDNL